MERSIANQVENRRHPRAPVAVPVFFETADLERSARKRLHGPAGWASLGGMFIGTPEPPARGTILSLRLYIGEADDAPPVGATAIVRWRRRRGEPRGMGIEFLDFEPQGFPRFDAWLRESLEGETPAAAIAPGVFLPAGAPAAERALGAR